MRNNMKHNILLQKYKMPLLHAGNFTLRKAPSSTIKKFLWIFYNKKIVYKKGNNWERIVGHATIYSKMNSLKNLT